MQITVNGKTMDINNGELLSDFLYKKLSLSSDGYFAVEVNKFIVPRSQYHNTVLNANDNIEIIDFIGGG